jgi:hypothetical protein
MPRSKKWPTVEAWLKKRQRKLRDNFVGDMKALGVWED